MSLSSGSNLAVRFEIEQNENMKFTTGVFPVVSPNGRWVVFPAAGADGVTRIWLRALDSVEERPLPGTETPHSSQPPAFWSPDSRFIAFSSNPGRSSAGQLMKLDITGGPPQKICDIAATVSGAWSRDDVIVFSTATGPLMRVSAAGGVATPLTVMDASRNETGHRYPRFLPDGRRFLYLRTSAPTNGAPAPKPEEQSLKPVVFSESQAAYSPFPIGGKGRLLFLRDTALFAQPFDPERLELSGEAVPVAEQVGSFPNATSGMFSISDTGVLAYRVGAAGTLSQLTWSGSPEVWVRPFVLQGEGSSGVKWMVSRGRFFDARWRGDGKELFFSGNLELWSVEVETEKTFHAGTPARLFPIGGSWIPLDAAGDGQRFLIASANSNTQLPYTVVLNWHAPLLKPAINRVDEAAAARKPALRWRPAAS